MTPLGVSFRVIGDAKPQGSKVAFNARNGKAMIREQGGLAFAAWRNAVTETAARERDKLGRALDGPLYLDCEFWFPMPKSRPKAMRAAGVARKISAPDLSKLVRLIEDALQAAGLIADDARIWMLSANKFENVDHWSGVDIRVRELPE